jgi:uncharacterized protein (DUF1778 family)
MRVKLDESIHFRCSGPEKSKIKALASIYTQGNISEFIVRAALEAPRTFYAERKSGNLKKKKR